MPASTPRRTAFATLLALLVATAPSLSSAQYMYLDANGDGVNSSADVVAPTGTTTLEVWLKTDTNRDGTPAVCPTGEELTINSYEFILHAANGQMNWLAYTNLQPDMVTSFGLGSNATDYHNGFGGGVILPPGTYHLGTLQVSVALGTPSLSIVSATPLSGGYLTEFGSQCLAQDQDNSMKLGLDWFDVDGVAYGGTPQAPPVLEGIVDMVVDEGEVATQTITATDADLQPLQFTKVSGPTYMTLTTTDTGAGTGTAHATITLAPGPVDQGVTSSTVRVTDGITSDEKSFGIRVVGANTTPPIVVVRETVSVPVGVDFSDNVSATDPDGDHMVLSMVQCPSFVVPFLFGPTDGYGNVGGTYRGRPASADVGTGLVIFEATDGLLSSFARTRYTVTGSPPPAPPPPDLFGSLYTVTELAGPATGIAMGDFDGDGDDDAAIASAAAGAVSIYASDRRGGLDLIQDFPAASPQAITSGDVDGDGDADVAYVDDRSGDVVVLGGPLVGAIAFSQTIHIGSHPSALALGDLNRDGWLDAVVALRGGDAVAILMNDGAGLLRAPSTLATSSDPMAVALGDYNGDTWLDVAVVCRASGQLNTFLNAGGGVLQSVVSMPLVTFGTSLPTGAVALSLGTDARIDLVIADENAGNRLYTSLGDGTFSSNTIYLGSVSTAIAAADLANSGRMGFVSGISSSPNNFPYDQDGSHLGVYAPGASELLKTYPQPGRRITGIAAGDVDADGRQDVIAVQSWTIKGIAAVYRNQGGGRLGSAVMTATGGAYNVPALADFNNDGHLDLAFGTETYLGKGDGTFENRINSPTSSGEGVLKAADLNQDGRQDVVFAPSCCDYIYPYLGDGTGHFVPAPTLRSNLNQNRDFDLGDVNEDGFPDLVMGSGTYLGPTPDRLEVWLARGDGTFAPPTLLDPALLWSLALSDYDSDGHLDIVYSDPQFRVYRGHGDGSFDPSNLLFPSQGGAFDLGDLNHDGRVDLLTSAGIGGLPLRAAFQASDHSFAPTQPFWTLGGFGYGVTSYSNAILDANGDGNADVLATFGAGLALGLGTGTANVSRRRVFGPAGGFKFVADMNEDGWPDILTAGGDFTLHYNPIIVFLNQSELLNRRLARTFLNGGSKTIPVGVTGRDLCLRVEPVGGSYENADIDLSSIVMKSMGTGSVNQIVATPAKKLVLGDTDGNGVAEISVCFSSADLGRLFSQLTGRRDVPVVLGARIAGGGRMYSEITLTIVRTGPSAAPSLSPNPLNPTGVFRFVTTRSGQARIQLFDVQGRLVRSVVDRALPAGTQEVPFDGKDGGGRTLASGIYFARVETTEGQYRMRVAILK